MTIASSIAPAASATQAADPSTLPVGRNRLLAALARQDFSALAPHLHEVVLQRDAVLQHAGAPIVDVYFPHGGLIALLRPQPPGQAIETGSTGRDGAVGFAAALGLTAADSTAVVRVAGAAARIPADRFVAAAAERPALRAMCARLMAATLAEARQNVVCAVEHDVRARFCRWLVAAAERLGSDTVPVTQDAIAHALGVQRTTVTLVGVALQQQGVISTRRGRIRIDDPAALARHACGCQRLVAAAAAAEPLPLPGLHPA